MEAQHGTFCTTVAPLWDFAPYTPPASLALALQKNSESQALIISRQASSRRPPLPTTWPRNLRRNLEQFAEEMRSSSSIHALLAPSSSFLLLRHPLYTASTTTAASALRRSRSRRSSREQEQQQQQQQHYLHRTTKRGELHVLARRPCAIRRLSTAVLLFKVCARRGSASLLLDGQLLTLAEASPLNLLIGPQSKNQNAERHLPVNPGPGTRGRCRQTACSLAPPQQQSFGSQAYKH